MSKDFKINKKVIFKFNCSKFHSISPEDVENFVNERSNVIKNRLSQEVIL